MGFQLVDRLCEFRHFKIDINQFVIEDLLYALIEQLHFMMKDLVTALIFVEDEIKYTDGVDRLQFEIPATFWA